jgi:hypothetical protein
MNSGYCELIKIILLGGFLIVYRALKHLPALIVFGVLLGCNFLPGFADSGTCQLGDGTVVPTYSVYGTWKKISGYDTPRSEAALSENYDVLIVLRSGETCRVEFKNAAQTTTTKDWYSYEHDIDLKSLSLKSMDGKSSDYSVNYRFSGSCGDTQMTWTSDNSGVEIFQYRSKNVDEASCSE